MLCATEVFVAQQVPAKKIDRLSGSSLSLPLGSTLMVEPAGLGQRFKTEVVGMERDRYLIVRTPRTPGSTEHLYVEKALTVRFMHEGHIFGFSSEVLWVMAAPFKLIFLRYPYEVEALNLRAGQRVDCFLPTSVRCGEEWLSGVVVNLSAGGCQVVLDAKAGQPLPTLAVNSGLVLEFRLAGSDKSVMVGGGAKNISMSENRLYLGVKFEDDTPEYTRELIARYVQSVADYMES
jgi:c-di-GMP-binding flagellar brake protein YcgR